MTYGGGVSLESPTSIAPAVGRPPVPRPPIPTPRPVLDRPPRPRRPETVAGRVLEALVFALYAVAAVVGVVVALTIAG